MEASDIIAICAAVIALSALGVSIWQGYLSRKHFKLSVKPHITVSWANFEANPISFTICNDGLGPAIIKNFSIEVDGNSIEGNGPDIYKEAIIRLGLRNIGFKSFNPTCGEAFGVGKSLELLNFVESKERLNEISSVLPRLKFKITYTSMYNDEEYTYYGNR